MHSRFLYLVFWGLVCASAIEIQSQFQNVWVVDGHMRQNNSVTVRCRPADFDNPVVLTVTTGNGSTHEVETTCRSMKFWYRYDKIGVIPLDMRLVTGAACETTYNPSGALLNFTNDLNKTVSNPQQLMSHSKYELQRSDNGPRWKLQGVADGAATIINNAGSGGAVTGGLSLALGVGTLIFAICHHSDDAISPAEWKKIHAMVGKVANDLNDFRDTTEQMIAGLQKWNIDVENEVEEIHNFDQNQLLFDQSVQQSLDTLQDQTTQLREALNALAESDVDNFNRLYSEMGFLYNQTAVQANEIAETDEELQSLFFYTGNATQNLSIALNKLAEIEHSHFLQASNRFDNTMQSIFGLAGIVQQLATRSQLWRTLNVAIQQLLAHTADDNFVPFLYDLGQAPSDETQETVTLDTLHLVTITDDDKAIRISLSFICNTDKLLDTPGMFFTINQFMSIMAPGFCGIEMAKVECDTTPELAEGFGLNASTQEADLALSGLCDGEVISEPVQEWLFPSNLTGFLKELTFGISLMEDKDWFIGSDLLIKSTYVSAADELIPDGTTPDLLLSGAYGINIVYAVGFFVQYSFMFFFPTLDAFRELRQGYLPSRLHFTEIPFSRNPWTKVTSSCTTGSFMAYEPVFLDVFRLTPIDVEMSADVSIDGGPIQTYTQLLGSADFAHLLPAATTIVGSPVPSGDSPVAYDIPFNMLGASPNPADRGLLYAMMFNETDYNQMEWILQNGIEFDPYRATDPPKAYQRPLIVDDGAFVGCDGTNVRAQEGTWCSILDHFVVAADGGLGEFSFTPKDSASFLVTFPLPEGQITTVLNSGCPTVTKVGTPTGYGIHFSNPGAASIAFSVEVTGPCPQSIAEISLQAGGSDEIWINLCHTTGVMELMITSLDGHPCSDPIDVTTTGEAVSGVEGLASNGAVINVTVTYSDGVEDRVIKFLRQTALDSFDMGIFILQRLKLTGITITPDDIGDLTSIVESAEANAAAAAAARDAALADNAAAVTNLTQMEEYFKQRIAQAAQDAEDYYNQTANRKDIIANLTNIVAEEARLEALAEEQQSVFNATFQKWIKVLNRLTGDLGGFLTTMVNDLKPGSLSSHALCKGLFGPIVCLFHQVMQIITYIVGFVFLILICYAICYAVKVLQCCAPKSGPKPITTTASETVSRGRWSDTIPLVKPKPKTEYTEYPWREY